MISHKDYFETANAYISATDLVHFVFSCTLEFTLSNNFITARLQNIGTNYKYFSHSIYLSNILTIYLTTYDVSHYIGKIEQL